MELDKGRRYKNIGMIYWPDSASLFPECISLDAKNQPAQKNSNEDHIFLKSISIKSNLQVTSCNDQDYETSYRVLRIVFNIWVHYYYSETHPLCLLLYLRQPHLRNEGEKLCDLPLPSSILIIQLGFNKLMFIRHMLFDIYVFSAISIL